MPNKPKGPPAEARDRLFPATAMPDADWWHALWPDPDAVVRSLQIGPAMRAVDLGCGDGYFTAAIARCVPRGRVIGLDLDPVMLKAAQAACASFAHCDWQLGDAMEVGHLTLGPVDYVFMANTFHGVPDKTQLARAVAAILSPEGRFVIVNWYPAAREETQVLGKPRGPRTELRLSPGATQEVVEAGGFVREALVPLPPYHYGLIFHKA
ncbi:MAG TPA: methyltransferase domain-containing protein [Acidiferrobacter sp.]|nr:methyltransferase domain-containing protein [Acidiferrobacter sp.]